MRRLPIVDESPSVDPELPSCVECGICCNFNEPRYAMIFEDDDARLIEADRALTHWADGRRYMRVKDGHCAALDTTGGLSVCTIYERRPFLCRDYPRGGEQCLAIRAKVLGLTAVSASA